MKSKLSTLAMAGLICAGLSAPPLALAQTTSTHPKAAAEEMNASGSSIKNGAPVQSMKHAYRATRDEVTDAALTTEVKAALMKHSETRTTAIHVKSNQGLVTLSGTVASPKVAERAQQIASSVSGVQSVKNDLSWSANANSASSQ